MKRLIICSFFLLGILVGNLFADEVREIELNDGSVIRGEIVSFGGGMFTVKSRSLGTVKIEESKIRAIRFRAPSGDKAAQIQALKQKMMSDEEIVNMLLSLQNDPDIQRVLEDPAIIEAVKSGDMNALLSSPKFMKLLDNRTIQDIRSKVMKQK